MNVTFRQLRVFLEVAEQGSITRAAQALHLTPPAVSMQVKELESQVGVPLFDRHGRSVSLSLAGEYFLVHAKRLLAVLKDAKMGPENVVKTTVFLADMADFPKMNEVYARYFGKEPPARSTIQAAGLPRGVKVEIDVIAAY